MVAQQAFLGDGFLQLIPAELGMKIGRIHDLQTFFGGEGLGSLAYQHHMFALRHHRVSSVDGVAYCRDSGNGTGH